LFKLESLSVDVGFCFYEDSVDTIKRAIESVRYHVRHIFAIDGKYEFLESDQELSYLSVREYLKSVSNCILIDAPNLNEVAKRTKYLDMCKTYNSKAMLILDSDEWVTADTQWENVYRNLAILRPTDDEPYVCAIRMDTHGGGGHFPKMWLNPHLIQYTKCHNFWTYPDGSIWKSTSGYPHLEGMFLGTDDYLRTKHTIEVTLEYQRKLMAYEKPFKKIYKINARG